MKRPLKLSVNADCGILRYKSIQVVAIKVEGQRSEVTMVEDRRIQLIASRVIETFGDKPSQVLNTGVYARTAPVTGSR